MELPTETSQPKGLIIIHVNVGQLPAFRAEAFVDRLKEAQYKALEKTRQLCDIIYVMTRTKETHIEYIPF